MFSVRTCQEAKAKTVWAWKSASEKIRTVGTIVDKEVYSGARGVDKGTVCTNILYHIGANGLQTLPTLPVTHEEDAQFTVLVLCILRRHC